MTSREKNVLTVFKGLSRIQFNVTVPVLSTIQGSLSWYRMLTKVTGPVSIPRAIPEVRELRSERGLITDPIKEEPTRNLEKPAEARI